MERVQSLYKVQVLAVAKALLQRSTSTRRRASSSLLSPGEMAKRSPTVFWNVCRHWGCVEAAQDELQQGGD